MHVSLTKESVEIVEKYFKRGDFSFWVNRQLKIYELAQQIKAKNPAALAKIKETEERMVKQVESGLVMDARFGNYNWEMVFEMIEKELIRIGSNLNRDDIFNLAKKKMEEK
jgi:hypothetical protein